MATKLTASNLERDPSKAGQSVMQGDYYVTYDDSGYATSAINTKHELFSDPTYDGIYKDMGWGSSSGSSSKGGGGGSSSGGSSGGGSAGSYGPSDYTEYLKDMYVQNLQSQLAGLKSSYDQNVADLKAEAEAIPKRYYEARNETAAQNDLQREYFNELAAANGLNSGATGQAALANSATLQGNLSSISEQEKDALSANALQQNKLAIEYQNAINQATASGNAALAQALYNEYVRQDNANMSAAQAAQEQANWQAQFDFSKQQYQDSLSQYQDSINAQNRDNAYNLAMTMLSAGVMPDTNTLTTAGISTADAMAIRLAALGASAGSGTSATSSGNSGSASKKTSSTSGSKSSGTSSSASSGNTTLKVDKENLPSYSTVLGNSESGYYGPAYGITLSTVQAMMNQNATKDQVEEYLLEQMDAGKINEYGVATILQALGTQRG